MTERLYTAIYYINDSCGEFEFYSNHRANFEDAKDEFRKRKGYKLFKQMELVKTYLSLEQ